MTEGTRKQILIVDDEISILKLLNFVLSKKYDLVIKESGIEAIEWLERGNDPDLIISDLEMPYFDGQTFTRNLKISGFYRDTPIVILSGKDNLVEVIDNMDYPVDAYLGKPFNPANLTSTIEKLINI